MKYRLMPEEPTEEMWGSLARDIITWTFFERPSGEELHAHIKRLGKEVPEWLSTVIPDINHCPPKGSVVIAVYRAAADKAPDATQDPELVERVARWLARHNLGLMENVYDIVPYSSSDREEYVNAQWPNLVSKAKALLKAIEGRE